MVTINPAKQLAHRQPGRLARGRQGRRRRRSGTHHPLSTYAIADRVYIDGTVYYDRIADERRLTDAAEGEGPALVAAEGGRTARPTRRRPRRNRGASRSGSAVDGSGRHARRDVQAPPARGCGRRQRRARRRRHRPTGSRDGDHQRADPSDHASRRSSAARSCIRGDADRGARRRRRGARRRDGHRRGRRRRLSGLHQRAHARSGLNEPGPRGFEDVNEMLDINPQLRTRVAYHAESDAIPVARANGITTVGGHARRRHPSAAKSR